MRCGAAVDLSKPTCGSCGVALDADGDAVPDALDRLIEQKARAMISAEKEEAKAAEERRVARERAEEEAKQRKEDESSLSMYERFLAMNEDAHVGRWHLPAWLGGAFVAAALLIGGVMLPSCGESALGRSIVAGHLMCPSKCPTCRGPGRVFTWHESGSSGEGDVSTQLCHNDVVDIDSMQWSAVSSQEDGVLKPYVLSLWWSALFDALLVAFVLFLVGPFAAAHFARKSHAEDRDRYAERIADLRRKLARPPEKPSVGYRG